MEQTRWQLGSVQPWDSFPFLHSCRSSSGTFNSIHPVLRRRVVAKPLQTSTSPSTCRHLRFLFCISCKTSTFSPVAPSPQSLQPSSSSSSSFCSNPSFLVAVAAQHLTAGNLLPRAHAWRPCGEAAGVPVQTPLHI